MKTYQFKTNINCGGCIEKIAPSMTQTAGIASWKVDTTNRDKILTVETESLNESGVIEVVKKAGFKAEAVGAGV
jgi:copper chaperone